MSKASTLTPIDVDGANSAASDNSEVENVLGPLSISAASFTPRFSMASKKSFTSEDYRREPEEAEGLEFQNVVPGQVAVVSVLSKFAEKEKWGLRRAVVGGRGNQDLGGLGEPSENDESAGKKEAIGAEIDVNGEAYTLHEDGVFRPLNLCMSVKAHFKGYAVHANGIFKPLGGSPAAIDAGTLFRVTPTNRYSPSEEGKEHTSRALHRIKNVSQLLMRGTSGHEEYMYVYDQHWEGFVRTNETKRFPPEKAMLKPGDLRSSVHEQNSEKLFASADEALRKVNRMEEMIHRKSLPSHMHRQASHKLLLRSLTLPSKKFVSPREAPGPTPQIPQTPAMFTKPAKEQVLPVDGEGSWLNIDLPTVERNSPVPRTITPNAKSEDWENLHTAPQPPEILNTPPFTIPNVFPLDDVICESTPPDSGSITSSQVSPTATAFRKPISRVLGPGASQATAPYAPAPQQLIDEYVLVLCFCGSQSSSRPRLARIVIPDNVSSGFDDMDLFFKMNDEYQKLRGFWRRWISLKGLKNIDLIEWHGNNKRQIFPGLFPVDDCSFSPGKLLDNYLNPCKVAGGRYWVDWVRRLNSEEDRYALEFIEGWRSDKIIMMTTLPIVLSIAGGVLWCLFGPEGLPHEYLTAFVLAIFVILVGWSTVGLFAVLSYTI